MKKTIRKIGLIALALLVGFGGYITYWPAIVNAARGGNTNAGQTGGCGNGGLSCTSEGVGTRVVDYDNYMSMKNEIGLGTSQKNDIAEKAAGMTNPVVFQFTYGAFDPKSGNFLDYMRGQLTPEVANRNNTVYMDPSSVPGGISMEQYRAFFDLAVSHGVVMQYDFDQTGAFVFDLDWLPDGVTIDALKDLKDIAKKVTRTESGPSSKKAFFQSKTIIDVGDGVPPGDSVQDSGWDGYVSVEFSVDDNPVTISFTHTMNYSGFALEGYDVMTSEDTAGTDAEDMETEDADDPDNNSTPYSITTGGGGSFGVFKTGGSTSDYSGGSQTVSLSPGETTTVCSHIMYDRKVATMTSKKHIKRKWVSTSTGGSGEDGSDDSSDSGDDSSDDSNDDGSGDASGGYFETVGNDHYDWYNVGYSGSGSSGACAIITRPMDPQDGPYNPDDPNGTAGGSSTANLMFAGESTKMAWDLWADTYDVRRLTDRQVVAYLVNAGPSREGAPIYGAPRYKGGDVYRYYSSARDGNIVGTVSFDGRGNIHPDNDDYLEGGRLMVVPDYTGYKYCNSGGYRYEWWYAINGDWKYDSRPSRSNYWFVYDASCRTIAKKPSVAIWNGSFMTQGGVATSASPRYNDTTLGLTGGPITLFGSWSEYMAVVGRDITFFTSGASLARNHANSSSAPRSDTNFDWSSLSVANSGKLGKSGITNNSTYLMRLSNFLENRAEQPQLSDHLGGMMNVSQTRILRRDGNLTITGDLEVNSGSYDNVYQLPQMVIFVHGDLNITSNVEQIDAWLIVDGTINTCSDFVTSSTEADAVNRLKDPCTKQLVFNGPVLANRVILNRSFGSDPLVVRRGTFNDSPAKYNAAEVFNFRSDAYLWGFSQAGRYGSSYTESYSKELAPRY